MKDRIITNVDRLYELVKNNRGVTVTDASIALGIDPDQVEEWAEVLEDKGLIRIRYPTTPLLSPILTLPEQDITISETRKMKKERASELERNERIIAKKKKEYKRIVKEQKRLNKTQCKLRKKIIRLNKSLEKILAGLEELGPEPGKEIENLLSELDRVRADEGKARKSDGHAAKLLKEYHRLLNSKKRVEERLLELRTLEQKQELLDELEKVEDDEQLLRNALEVTVNAKQELDKLKKETAGRPVKRSLKRKLKSLKFWAEKEGMIRSELKQLEQRKAGIKKKLSRAPAGSFTSREQRELNRLQAEYKKIQEKIAQFKSEHDITEYKAHEAALEQLIGREKALLARILKKYRNEKQARQAVAKKERITQLKQKKKEIEASLNSTVKAYNNTKNLLKKTERLVKEAKEEYEKVKGIPVRRPFYRARFWYLVAIALGALFLAFKVIK